jgi:hypothetical protein
MTALFSFNPFNNVSMSEKLTSQDSECSILIFNAYGYSHFYFRTYRR